MLSKIKNAASQKLDTKSNKLQKSDTDKDVDTEKHCNAKNKNGHYSLLESIVSKLRRAKKGRNKESVETTTNDGDSKNMLKVESSENQDITLRLSSMKLDEENSSDEKSNCNNDSRILSPTNQTDEEKEIDKTASERSKNQRDTQLIESKDEDAKCSVSSKSLTNTKDSVSSSKHGDKEYFLVVNRSDMKKGEVTKKVDCHTKHKKEEFITVPRRERRTKTHNVAAKSETVSAEINIEENLKEIQERLANLNVKSVQKTKEIVLVDERKKELDKRQIRIIDLPRGPMRTAKSNSRHNQESAKSKYSHINVLSLSGGGLLNEDDDPSELELPTTISDNGSYKTNVQNGIPQVVQIPRNGIVQTEDVWNDVLEVLNEDLELEKLAPIAKELQQLDLEANVNNVNLDMFGIEQSASLNLQQNYDISLLESLIASGMQANEKYFENYESFAHELCLSKSDDIPTVWLNDSNIDPCSGSESDSPTWLPNTSVASSNAVSPMSNNFTYSNDANTTGVSVHLSPLQNNSNVRRNSPSWLQNSGANSPNNVTSMQMSSVFNSIVYGEQHNNETTLLRQHEGVNINKEMPVSPTLYQDNTNRIPNMWASSPNYDRSNSSVSAATNSSPVQQNMQDDPFAISQPNSIVSSSSESNICYSEIQSNMSMSPTSKKLTNVDSMSESRRTVLPYSPSYSVSNSSNSPFVSPARFPNTYEMSPVSIGSPNLGAVGVDRRWNVTKQLFAEIVRKLNAEEYAGVCYKIQAMKMNDVYRLISATLDALPKEKPERVGFALGIFYAACHRLLMTNPCAFHAADLAVDWLMAGAVQCCQLGLVIRCLLDCYRLSVSHCDGASCKHDAVFKQRDARGNSIVYRLVCQGDTYADALAEILSHSNASLDLSALNIDGYSALHLACKHHGEASEDGSTRSCQRCALLLIEHGRADVMQTDGKSGYTPLHLAVDSPNADPQLVTLLLENCADKRAAVNFKNYGNQTPLELARARQKGGEGQKARRIFELLKKSR